MPAPNKSFTNPLFQRIATDGVFGSKSTVGEQTNFGQQNAMANAGLYLPGTFGAQNAVANRTGAVSPAIPTEAIPSVMSAGLPAGVSAGSFVPQNGMVPINPVHAYAPTGLRDRAIQAGGRAVFGQGDVAATYDGMNAMGGRKFSLSQIMPIGGPNNDPEVFTPNPIGQENLQPLGARPAMQPSAPQMMSKNAGLLSAFPQGSPVGDYIRAQEQARLPIDPSHLELLSKFQLEREKMNASGNKQPPIPAGYMPDPDKPGAVKPIPGGPAEAKAQEAQAKQAEAQAAEQERAKQMIDSANTVIGNIDKILPIVSKWESGVLAANTRALQKAIKGSDVFAVEELKAPILANIATEKLQAMRAASKNGASGFGQLSIRELDLLEKARGSLESAQDPKQLVEVYRDVKSHFLALRATQRMGLIDPATATPRDIQNQNAVKWAINNIKDPRAQKILEVNQ